MIATPPKEQAQVAGSELRAVEIGMGWLPDQAGGLNRVYYNYMREMAGAGVPVKGLITGHVDRPSEYPDHIIPFSEQTDGLIGRWRGIRSRFKKIQEDWKPGLVTSHFALYAFPVVDLIKDTPFLVHFHGPWAFEGAVEGANSISVRGKKMIESRVYNRASKFVVLSNAFRQVLMERYGISGDLIEVIGTGVEAGRFGISESQKEAREILGWHPDRPTIMSVRRLARRMGLENLVEATSQIKKELPDIQVLIAGKGPMEAELNLRIKESGVEDNVRLLGFVPDEHLPLAYRASDLTVVPTVALEGFGMITLESLAAGTPVLVTPVGGLPEAVKGLSENLILAGHEVSDLVDGLLDALKGDREVPSQEACMAFARDNHDWPVQARKLADIYRTVAG